MQIGAGIIGRLHARRLISLLVLAALLAAHVPIPIKLPPPGKDHSSRYPCENNPCGCLTAEQCWQSCCCRTNAEKLAWAEANGVTPPEYVVIAAEKEAADEAPRTCCSERGACCAHEHDSTACCEVQAAPPSEPNDNESDDARTVVVIGIAAQHCRGLSSHWLNLPWMIVEANVPIESYVPVAPWIVAECYFATDVADRPPTPPPRVEAALHTC